MVDLAWVYTAPVSMAGHYICFCGKISGFLQTMPEAVWGGIMLLLFGMIVSLVIKSLVESKTNMANTRNQVIVSVVLTTGIVGAIIKYGTFALAGIGLAALVGILLNLILPQTKKEE